MSNFYKVIATRTYFARAEFGVVAENEEAAQLEAERMLYEDYEIEFSGIEGYDDEDEIEIILCEENGNN